MPANESARTDGDPLFDYVPPVAIGFDGDARQAIGIDLPVAVINLDHRPDKLQAVTARMAAVGLDKVVRIPAVYGAPLDLAALAPILAPSPALIEAPIDSHLTMTRPAVGCFLSHLAAWRFLIESELPSLLVLEDDAYPMAGFDASRFCRLVGALRSDVRLLFLGRILMNGMAVAPDADGLARLFYFNGTFAYVITPAAVRALLPHLLPMNGHIDHEMSRVLIERRAFFAAHAVEPPMMDPDWTLRSDCYVPMAAGEARADLELAEHLAECRRTLAADGFALQSFAG